MGQNALNTLLKGSVPRHAWNPRALVKEEGFPAVGKLAGAEVLDSRTSELDKVGGGWEIPRPASRVCARDPS